MIMKPWQRKVMKIVVSEISWNFCGYQISTNNKDVNSEKLVKYCPYIEGMLAKNFMQKQAIVLTKQ